MDSYEMKFDPGVYQNQPNQINHKKHITTLNYFSFFNKKNMFDLWYRPEFNRYILLVFGFTS